MPPLLLLLLPSFLHCLFLAPGAASPLFSPPLAPLLPLLPLLLLPPEWSLLLPLPLLEHPLCLFYLKFFQLLRQLLLVVLMQLLVYQQLDRLLLQQLALLDYLLLQNSHQLRRSSFLSR